MSQGRKPKQTQFNADMIYWLSFAIILIIAVIGIKETLF